MVAVSAWSDGWCQLPMGQLCLGIPVRRARIRRRLLVPVATSRLRIDSPLSRMRGARQPFHWLLLLWHIQLALQSIYNSWTSPEDYRFKGDTLGVDISLAWVGPLLFGGFALLSIWWVVRDIKSGPQRTAPQWTLANRVLLLIAVSLLPIQFVLLRFGPQHGPADQAGVILTMLQWVIINLGLFPWSSSSPQSISHKEESVILLE